MKANGSWRLFGLVISLWGLTRTLMAAWWVNVCPGGQKYVGSAQQGPFNTREEAQNFANSEDTGGGGCFTVTGSDDSSSSSSSGSGDPTHWGADLGSEMGTKILAPIVTGILQGPSDEEIRQQQLEEQREEAERARQKAERERQKALEEKIEQEKHDALMKQMKSVDDGSGGDLPTHKSIDDSSDSDFMQAPAKKRSKVQYVDNYKDPLPTHKSIDDDQPAETPAPKQKATPTPHPKNSGVHHANLQVDGVTLTGEPDSPIKDQLWAENSNDYAVEIYVTVNDIENGSHSVRSNVTLQPGQRVNVGWAGNLTNDQPWDYQTSMSVSKNTVLKLDN
jgi:hypothetical protein